MKNDKYHQPVLKKEILKFIEKIVFPKQELLMQL